MGVLLFYIGERSAKQTNRRTNLKKALLGFQNGQTFFRCNSDAGTLFRTFGPYMR